VTPLVTRSSLVLLLATLVSAPPSVWAAEGDSTQTVTIGPEYAASALHSFWLGAGYRDLWTTPVTIPVLDLKTYAGGLTPVRQVGGLQTPGLALRGADGRSYTFRSLRKQPDRSLPPEWRKSWAAWIVRDHTSTTHPGAALLLHPLAEAAGLLHTTPELVVMPDDSLLGSWRKTFAGAPGTIEEYPLAQPEATSFHGATEIINTRELWNRWLQGPENRIDSKAFLRARVLDLYVANWDRHRGQWRWARLPGEDRWEPLPEDPDMAFGRNDGVAVALARSKDPKLVRFHDRFGPRLEGSTLNGADVDRWLLTDLDRPTFEQVVRETQAKFSDEVIDAAVHQLPQEWQPLQKNLAMAMRSRRELLVDQVMHYYRNLARDVDVHATDRDEVVSVHRIEGGVLDVGIALAGDTQPYYQRRFQPSETEEVRIYLHGGNDRVERSGPAGGPILVRVVAGDGADLVDDSGSGGTDIWAGTGTLTNRDGRGTHSHKAWSNPEPEADAPWLEPRNFGHWTTPSAEIGYGSDVGLVLGAGVARSNWGFRAPPEAKRQQLSAAWSTGESRGRLSYLGRFRSSGSKDALQLEMLASGIEQVYFFGFGNENAVPPHQEQYRTGEEFVLLHPSFLIEPSRRLNFHVGPTFRGSWSPTNGNNVLNDVEPYGLGQFAEAGVRAGVDLDSRRSEKPNPIFEYSNTHGRTLNTRMRLDGFYFPPILDVEKSFGGLEGEVASYLGQVDSRAQLAARIGAKHLWGDYPWFESAFLGGRSTLPGYSRNRFAGDTSLYGGVEASTWLFSMKFLPVACRFGVLGLGGIGRVWLPSESSNEWHGTWGVGGALQPVATRITLSGTVAKSTDETKFYLTTRALF
jgi:hypothetical protein